MSGKTVRGGRAMTATSIVRLTFLLVSEVVKLQQTVEFTKTRRTTTRAIFFSPPPVSIQRGHLTDAADPFIVSFHRRQRKTPVTCLHAAGAHEKTIIIFLSAERRGKAGATSCSAARQQANGTFLGRAARGASAKGICHGVFRRAAAKTPSDARRGKGAAPIPVEKSGGGAR